MKKIFILLLIFLCIAPTVILAGPLAPPVRPTGGFTNIWDFFLAILGNIIWMVFVAVAIVMFIYAGFMFVTASGEPAKLHSAKMALIGGFIGVVVAVLAISIPYIIQDAVAPATSPATTLAPYGGTCHADADCVSGSCFFNLPTDTAGFCAAPATP